MKKRIAFILTLAMILAVLTGCTGTTVVYYSDCTCTEEIHAAAAPEAAVEAEAPAATEEPAVTEEPAATEAPAVEAAAAEAAALKTGLAIVASAADSKSATAEENGEAKYDVSIVAVTVDENGVIDSCIIDSVGASVAFDASGAIVTDLSSAVQTKNELGEAYGMKAYAGSKYEWNEQAAALAQYAAGKTVAELKEGAVNESGKAKDADLATTATIYLGGYVSAIEEAVNNAQDLGARAGDELRLAVINGLGSSAAAAADAAGNAQLDCDAAVLTVKDGVITSCLIDSLQAKLAFDAAGTITSDTAAALKTKNQLGEAYGMKAYAGAKYEWNEQAAAFAQYAVGKTAEQVAGIAVSEGKTTEADLAATVTISIGGFQALIAKAMQ